MDYLIAGSPSFTIGGGGDRRRSRRGLSTDDIQRLLDAYPQDADRIREMYLPGPTLPINKVMGPETMRFAGLLSEEDLASLGSPRDVPTPRELEEMRGPEPTPMSDKDRELIRQIINGLPTKKA